MYSCQHPSLLLSRWMLGIFEDTVWRYAHPDYIKPNICSERQSREKVEIVMANLLIYVKP